MDLSNKSLALLLLAAIVISLGGTLVSLNKINQITYAGGGPGVTGFATGTGNVTVNISTAVGCTVDSEVDFGTSVAADIYVSSENANDAYSSFGDCTSLAACRGMQLNNTGNVELNVSFLSALAGANFITGDSALNADFQYRIENGTDTNTNPGCEDNGDAAYWAANSWTTVPTTLTWGCLNLTPITGNDVMRWEYNVTVRTDTYTGRKSTLITFTCNEI
ncbi:hypothetical protein ACFL1B_04275 [Nanoarchaeota archaeon]